MIVLAEFHPLETMNCDDKFFTVDRPRSQSVETFFLRF